ncbi:nuclear transport factor 2 family protein [Maricaulis sp. CAU 1757]
MGLLVLALFGQAIAPAVAAQNLTADEADLLALNERMMRQMIIERSPDLFERHAAENFRVLAPGGMFEDRDAVVAGLSGWDVTDITLSGQELVRDGDLAIITARLDIDGTMRPVGRWGPLKVMSVWQRRDGTWSLVARSLTPCLPPLIEIGRC